MAIGICIDDLRTEHVSYAELASQEISVLGLEATEDVHTRTEARLRATSARLRKTRVTADHANMVVVPNDSGPRLISEALKMTRRLIKTTVTKEYVAPGTLSGVPADLDDDDDGDEDEDDDDDDDEPVVAGTRRRPSRAR